MAEWAYRTPRFPQGIKGSDLSLANAHVQRETMTVWFLANHIRATGPYFSFAEAAASKLAGLAPIALSHMGLNHGVQNARFGSAFFNGGQAFELLKAEFENLAPDAIISEIAGRFDGLWEVIPIEPTADLAALTADERNAVIISRLDDLWRIVHGGIGHNGPPDGPSFLTEQEKDTVLKATADTRSAVQSSDYSAAILAWQDLRPILERIGNSLAEQIQRFLSSFSEAAGSVAGCIAGAAVGLTIVGVLGYELEFWDKAHAINSMLAIAMVLPALGLRRQKSPRPDSKKKQRKRT